MHKTAFWLVTLLLCIGLSANVTLAQEISPTGVTILVNRDGVNVRILPAIGAEVIGFVNAGWTAPGTGRSPDNEWVRIDFNGQEGWIGLAVINVFGDLNSLPVADPRTIPYGGFEAPRSGTSDATSSIVGRLAQSGLRLRAGPTTAYPVLANIPRFTELPLLGRTANNAWIQVNYNGTLGWVTAPFVEIQNGASIIQLPMDGVVASTAPASEGTRENYLGTLRLMLERINLAQPSLDSIRGTWTTVALGQRAPCQNFPARPSDINIANDLLAAYFPILDPLQRDFNTAMANVRLAVELWIEACGFPQPPQGVVGQATVQGALNTIQTADFQFADLRGRITALLPPEIGVGEGECLFQFQEQFDVLKVINIGEIVRDTFDARSTATGYCVDVAASVALRIEVLQVRGSVVPLVSLSPLDNPTNFLGVGRGITGQGLLSVGPVLISTSGRYLLVVSDIERTGTGDFAILLTNIAGATVLGPGLSLDPVTGEPIINPIGGLSTPIPGVIGTPTVTGPVVCPSVAFSCNQLFSCAEARACLQAGNFTLDPDNDGIACEGPPLNCQ